MDASSFRDLYPFEAHYRAVGGHRLHYVDEGRGDPVVMVHGNPTWSFYFRELASALKDRWRVVVPDHIGCGLSDKPQDYDYTLRRHTGNLEELLEGLGLDRITLVVHDWGGAIGMGYARRHPGKVRRLIVANTAAFRRPPDAPFPWRLRSCRIPGFGDFAVRRLNLFVKAALSMASAQPAKMTPAVKAGLSAPYDSYENRVAVLRFVQDIPAGPSDPSFAEVVEIERDLAQFGDRPMLLAWGLRDFCFNEAYLRHWQRLFPGAEVERYEDAGHYVFEDARERIVARVRRFLEDHPIP